MYEETADPRDLLRRILRSRYFDHSELALVLEYLCESTQRGEAVNEQNIAAGVFGDAAASGEARRAVDQVRVRLKRYFENDGRHEELRLVIPADGYRAFFYEADPSERLEATPSALERFWAPHAASGSRMIHGVSNDAVSLEDVYAMIRLVMWLQEQRIRVEVSNVADLPSEPVILVGTAGTNPLVASCTEPGDEQFALQRIPASSEHGVITVIRTLAGARCATDPDAMETVAEPFASGFPPAFGLKL